MIKRNPFFLYLAFFIGLILAMLCLPLLAAEGVDGVESLVKPQSGTWSRDGLKAALDTPLILFGVMLVASAINGLKQMRTARQAGGGMSFVEYWSHLPDTMATLLGNVLAFGGLILFDQLNFAAALGIGYGVNSITDMLPGARSVALAETMPVAHPDTKPVPKPTDID